MVDFRLSETQQMLRDLAHGFATDHVRPRSEHWDRTGEFPTEAIAAAHEAGLMNLHVPEAYGGMGMSVLDEVSCLLPDMLERRAANRASVERVV